MSKNSFKAFDYEEVKKLKELLDIASQFKLEGEIATIRTLGEGFINDTFIIEMSEDSPKYILQKKNKNIFKNIPGMMDNILAVTNHLKSKIAAAGGDPCVGSFFYSLNKYRTQIHPYFPLTIDCFLRLQSPPHFQ